MPPSLTTWTRLEPYARSLGLEGGLRAAVHDPLWLLARQWQLGEFQGEDVGSPVQAYLQMDCTRLTRYQPGGIPPSWSLNGRIQPDAAIEGQLLTAVVPLEALVERERIHVDDVLQPRLAAEAGLHFWRLLDAHGAGAHRTAILTRFPLPAPAENPLQPLDPDTRRFLSIMAGRVPDGTLLFAVLQAVDSSSTATSLPEQVAAGVQAWRTWQQGLAEADSTNVANAVTAWLAWYDAWHDGAEGAEALFSEPPAAGNPSWIPQRMEYEALVATPTRNGEVVLAVPEYSEGHLDWYSLDVLPAGSLSAARTDLTPAEIDAERITRSAIPVPVSFRGMPASRWWEFEDARVDFGAVTAAPQQLVRLLLIEFGLVAGDDWFIMPVVVPVGRLCHTNWLLVSDTFGARTLVSSARAVDAPLTTAEGDLPWDLFRLARDRRPIAGSGRPVPDALFLPPVLGPSLHGVPLEEVLFLRDEMANMAWAVERIVESPIGRPLNRSEAYFTARRQPDGAVASATSTEAGPGSLVYRLVTEIPEHWVPLLPVRLRADAPPIRLVRGGVGQGRILDVGHDEAGVPLPLYLQEEEVPREGARVTRAFQYARWIDGQTYLWIGRRKGVGRGEGSSGLRFDVLEPTGLPPAPYPPYPPGALPAGPAAGTAVAGGTDPRDLAAETFRYGLELI